MDSTELRAPPHSDDSEIPDDIAAILNASPVYKVAPPVKTGAYDGVLDKWQRYYDGDPAKLTFADGPAPSAAAREAATPPPDSGLASDRSPSHQASVLDSRSAISLRRSAATSSAAAAPREYSPKVVEAMRKMPPPPQRPYVVDWITSTPQKRGSSATQAASVSPSLPDAAGAQPENRNPLQSTPPSTAPSKPTTTSTKPVHREASPQPIQPQQPNVSLPMSGAGDRSASFGMFSAVSGSTRENTMDPERIFSDTGNRNVAHIFFALEEFESRKEIKRARRHNINLLYKTFREQLKTMKPLTPPPSERPVDDDLPNPSEKAEEESEVEDNDFHDEFEMSQSPDYVRRWIGDVGGNWGADHMEYLRQMYECHIQRSERKRTKFNKNGWKIEEWEQDPLDFKGLNDPLGRPTPLGPYTHEEQAIRKQFLTPKSRLPENQTQPPRMVRQYPALEEVISPEDEEEMKRILQRIRDSKRTTWRRHPLSVKSRPAFPQDAHCDIYRKEPGPNFGERSDDAAQDEIDESDPNYQFQALLRRSRAAGGR